MRVAFIGCGAVNFGGVEGSPWDHATRLEQLNSSGKFEISIVALVDAMQGRAEATLAARRRSVTTGEMYSHCACFTDYRDMLAATKPEAVFVGLPPSQHGDADHPVELAILQAGAHVFVEKPISAASGAEAVQYAKSVQDLADSRSLVVSVGYMMRYLKAVAKVRQLVQEHAAEGLPLAINMTYNCAYHTIPHHFWWDARMSGGPIVEQATHFVDLALHLCGPDAHVVEESVSGVSIGAHVAPPLARVPEMSVDESTVPQEHRLPRATLATWRMSTGTVVSLSHALLLQGLEYEASLEVWADGLRIRLLDPYNDRCRVQVRVGPNDSDVVFPFPDDDPYLSEDDAFFQAICDKSNASIRCSIVDAATTYSLTKLLTDRTK